jgi:flagellar biosynthesis component FlhA
MRLLFLRRKKGIRTVETKTVKTYLMDYLLTYVDEEIAREILKKYIDEHRDYIGHVLDNSYEHRLSYCQISSMVLNSLLLEHFRTQNSQKVVKGVD